MTNKHPGLAEAIIVWTNTYLNTLHYTRYTLCASRCCLPGYLRGGYCNRLFFTFEEFFLYIILGCSS